MSISQNKLTPVLVVLAALVVVYVIYVKASARSAPVASGAALTSVPQPGGNPASAPRSGGLFAGSTLPPARSADTDNNAETLNTVIASNREVRAQIQKVLEDNEALRRQAADVRNSDDAVAARVRAQLQAEAAVNPRQTASASATSTAAQNTAAPGNAVGGLIDNGLNAASQIINGIGGQPGTQAGAQSGGQNGAQPGAQAGAAQGNMSGLGYDGANASPVNGTAAGAASMAAPVPGAALTRVIAPLGYRATGGGEHASTLERSSLTPARVPATSPVPPSGAAPAKPEAEPYFTIPENATLVRSTAMTTLVGR
ncbi:MAG: hypothetical protein JF606_00590, partial [Burkholderiales bacterium]|nr:hypothetical protein [Burkholderiales bacterium]